MRASARTLVEVDGQTEEVWPLPLGRDALFALFRGLFDEHWGQRGQFHFCLGVGPKMAG